MYVTNQPDIVAHAKYCYNHYPTIVNNIPQDSNHYNNTMDSFALIDSKLSASQTDIGESSNLAQICLTYTYNFDPLEDADEETNRIRAALKEKYENYVCILSVVAQAAIDNAKRTFDIDITGEIKRIRADMDIDTNKRPAFWIIVKGNSDRKNKIKKPNTREEIIALNKQYKDQNINFELKCPMNKVYDNKFYKADNEPNIEMSEFFHKHSYDRNTSKKMARRVEKYITDYSLEIMNYNIQHKNDSKDEQLLLRSDYEDMISELRTIAISHNNLFLFSWLIDRAFVISYQTKNSNSNLNKNRSLLLKVLYDVNPKALLECFDKHIKIND